MHLSQVPLFILKRHYLDLLIFIIDVYYELVMSVLSQCVHSWSGA